MPWITISLTDDEAAALAAVAIAEKRRPQQQAAVILSRALGVFPEPAQESRT